MRKLIWTSLLAAMCLSVATSCKDEKNVNHDRERHFSGPTISDNEGNKYPTGSVTIDLDGDGVAECLDVMKQNISVSRNADGSAFFDDGSGSAMRYCYKNMDINCDTMGALYTASVSVNQSLESLAKNTLAALDESGSGVADYLEDVANNSSAEIAQNHGDIFSKDIVSNINSTLKQAIEVAKTNPLADKPTQSALIVDDDVFSQLMTAAVEHAIAKNTVPGTSENQAGSQQGGSQGNPQTNPTNPDYKPLPADVVSVVESAATAYDIDIATLERNMASEILVAIVQQIKNENAGKFVDSAFVYPTLVVLAKEQATIVAKEVSESIAESILSEFAEAKKNPSSEAGKAMFVQGICMDGWHIPSDAEWMAYEHAFGMPLDELPLSGESENSRGADEDVAQKMMTDLGISFSGYGAENGTYAQLDEAGVFYTSTGGVDDKGTYIWVRQFDDSFKGVKRYKHRANSVLGVRCFKN